MSENYSHIILGGGCAGLQLADALLEKDRKQKLRILILEQSSTPPQKTWCMWARTKTPHRYDHLVSKRWSHLTFRGPEKAKQFQLGKWEYQYISGEHFFQDHLERFEGDPRVTILHAAILDFGKAQQGYWVRTEAGTWHAPRMYSSLPDREAGHKAKHFLWQHFMGWFIRTEQPAFDPGQMTLMDFSVQQRDGACFVYVLPFSETTALIEYTVFSGAPWEEAQYEQELKAYLNQLLSGRSYHIEKTESGRIPMTDFPFSRYSSKGPINIGGAAGMIKPTTGYAFKRILQDSSVLARLPEIPDVRFTGRFFFYDKLLLRIIQEDPEKVARIMEKLFIRQPISRVFRFLDERTTLLEDGFIFSRLPWRPFLKALFREWRGYA